MGRASLAPDSGMIFTWDRDTHEGFWMKDTLIPLSIAFISSEGIIIDIQDMEPQTLAAHSPTGPYRYAVETSKGFFAGQGISKGDRVDLGNLG